MFKSWNPTDGPFFMRSINLIFAVHNHQPVGNFESVFEEAYRLSYKPFLDVLERHPAVKFTQHWSGTLLEWLLKNHPEFVDRMKGMVQRGQMDLLTGAYYEAMLPVIPEEDRVGQILKLTAAVKNTFGKTPRGMWLAERVWEQQMVASLGKAGVEYVIVDDTHFRHAGLLDEQLLGYYVTEEQGQTLSVLPIDKTLRYSVPFRPLPDTFEYFRRVASSDGRRIVIHADDGEKFGGWPKTYHTVYEEGWLESFCRMLEHESSWVKTIHIGTVLDLFAPAGRIYLPAASYSEMMKWALDARGFVGLENFEQELKDLKLYDENAMFVRGGFWRNFLVKYPESNQMHKKMLRVASRVHAPEGNGAVSQEVREALWAGQCNDPYWHGVFGGLYLPNLRFAVYHNLLKAEAGMDALEPRREPLVEEVDFDADGRMEVVVETRRLDFCYTPSFGGALVELSVKPEAVNLIDIMNRREEGYHRRLTDSAQGRPSPGAQVVEVKEPGLEQHLTFDWYRHGSLIDHFFAEGTTLQGFMRSRYQELGDFVNQPYAVSTSVRGRVTEVALERQGAIWRSGVPHRLTVRKVVRYTEGEDVFTVEYAITNREQQSVDLWFGIEWCVGSMAGDSADRFYDIEGRQLVDCRLRSMGEEISVRTFKLVDRWLHLQTVFTADAAATVWRFPLETVSLSEGGFERIYQGSVVVPHWRIRLEPAAEGVQFRLRMTQSVTQA